MSASLPVTYTHTHNPSAIPLGTADWLNFDGNKKPIYGEGDLWLGRLPCGESVGYNDDRHILLVSGTRSGKGASVIIPNLCLWPGSAVIIDPKGENAMVTARRRGRGSKWARGMGQTVHILDPFGEVKTPYDDFADLRASYNPLDILIEGGDSAVDDAARIADALIISENGRDAFFDDSAKSAIKALLLHVASSPNFKAEKRNLITLRHILLAGDDEMCRLMELNGESEIPSGIGLLFKAMRRNPAYGGVVAQSGAMLDELLESSPRTLMSVLQVARTNTDFLESPALRRCLEQSSFALNDIKAQKTTLYLCLPQRYMASHHRWLRLMATLILGEMERARPSPAPAHPVLMVLDEFPALGRMTTIENAAAQIAGYGVKLMFVAQTLAQLKDVYKENWETLVANAGLKLFFGNDDHFTREYVSKLVGEIEISRWTQSENRMEGKSQSVGHGSSHTQTQSSTYGRTTSFGSSGGRFNYSDTRSSSSTKGVSVVLSKNTTSGTSESLTHGRTETLHKRYLLNPDEIGRVFGSRENPAMLALVSGMQPLALRRTLYFSEKLVAGLFDPHPDHALPATLNQRERSDEIARRIMGNQRKRMQREAQEKHAEQERLRLAHVQRSEEIKLKDAARRQRKLWLRRYLSFGVLASLGGALVYSPLGVEAMKVVHPGLGWEIGVAKLQLLPEVPDEPA